MTSSIIPPDLLNSYNGSGFARRDALPFTSKVVLLVIDVCAAYLTPGSSLYAPDRFDAALANIEKLITLFRRKDLPIVFTRIVHETPGEAGVWYQKAPSAIENFAAGSPMGEFPPTSAICRPRSDRIAEQVLVKRFASCFFGSPLASVLSKMGIETVVCCGFSTSGCVRATTLDAMQCGFYPYVVRDACGDRHAFVHESNLFDLQAKYAEVVTQEKLEQLVIASRQETAVCRKQ